MSQSAPTTPPPSSAPTPLSERALAPDLARGVMLLFIALANTHPFLQGSSQIGGFPQDEGTLGRVVAWLSATLVDQRAFPMFGLLFGYGVARIVARQKALQHSPKQTRRLLRRRSLVLLAVGAAHLLFLFDGDILSVYGALLFIGLWAVNWKDVWLMVVGWCSLALAALMLAAPGLDKPEASQLPADLASQFTERLQLLPVVLLAGWFLFVCPYLVGLWAGRRRVLEQPEQYRRLLTVTAAVGIAVSVAGAQPAALLTAGVLASPNDAAAWWALHFATGTLGGFGYAAAIALLALRLDLGADTGPITKALAATGQRSMTFYLAQSVVWLVVFMPYTLDLSEELSVPATAALALATWAATVVLADRMRAAGRRGPFEALTRRLTYGRIRS